MENTQELNQFEKYLTSHVMPGTANTYLHSLRGWFATINGGGVTPESAQRYIDSLSAAGKSPSTISTRAHSIMRYFRWKGVEIHLDCPTIRFGEPEYLTLDKVNIVIDACYTQLEKTLVTVLFDTAVRITELLNLDTDDIDWDLKLISVTRKGGRRAEVNIGDKALEELAIWIKSRTSRTKRVFMDLTYYDAWTIVKKLGQRVHIKLHPHIFRHSRAIHLLRNKVPINVVSQHLGHTSIVTTINIYGRFATMDFKEQITTW